MLWRKPIGFRSGTHIPFPSFWDIGCGEFGQFRSVLRLDDALHTRFPYQSGRFSFVVLLQVYRIPPHNSHPIAEGQAKEPHLHIQCEGSNPAALDSPAPLPAGPSNGMDEELLHATAKGSASPKASVARA